MRQPKDWGQPCPNPACTHARRMQQGNVRAIATYRTHSGTRRILCCHTCATSFAATRATVFCALRTSEEQVMMALTMRLGRGDLAGIDFGLGVTAETVVARLRRAAQQAEASNQHRLRTRPVTQVQRDERGNGIGRKHAQETDAAGASVPNGEDGRQGVWVRLAPECRWMIAAMVGPRTRDTAKEVVAATKARVTGLPACVSDGFTGSLAALLAACHVMTPLASTGKRGRPRKPRCAPHPDLVYGHWVTPKNQSTLLPLRTRVVLGAERRTPRGCTISTALVERVHLTLRQSLAPLARAHAGNGGRCDGSRLDLS